MKKTVFLLLAALALAGAGVAALGSWPIGRSPQLASLSGDPKQGAYLARMAGCIACHTNSDEGGAPLAGGVELRTAYGSFYSPNLTTDEEHGIGTWTIEDFAKAVRQGISPEGQPYYPAFPYTFYARLSDQEIADLWAAFQTVPAVAQPSRPQQLIFPFSLRANLKLWRAMFFDESDFETVKDKSKTWNRGRYIVQGPAHCGACHTPRNLLGARKAGFSLHGAKDLPGGGKSPPILAERLREEGWTVDNLKYALKTGILPDGDAFGGAMGEVVRDGTAFLTAADRKAIAVYLLDAE